jgi:hypothetical protein
MEQVKYGQARSKCIYAVCYEQQWIYVGQTSAGVRLRLWKHVHSNSTLGVWLYENELITPEPICHVFVIDTNIDQAERYYISLFDPLLNVVKYKDAITLPPVEKAIEKPLDIERQHWKAAYGAISGLKGSAQANIFERRAIQQPKPDNSDHLMERIYAKAYRDPNHPDNQLS